MQIYTRLLANDRLRTRTRARSGGYRRERIVLLLGWFCLGQGRRWCDYSSRTAGTLCDSTLGPCSRRGASLCKVPGICEAAGSHLAQQCACTNSRPRQHHDPRRRCRGIRTCCRSRYDPHCDIKPQIQQFVAGRLCRCFGITLLAVTADYDAGFCKRRRCAKPAQQNGDGDSNTGRSCGDTFWRQKHRGVIHGTSEQNKTRHFAVLLFG